MKNKDKRFYKIDPSSKRILEVYSRAKDIPSFNGGMYQHLRGLSDLHTDGYIYRRAEDVVLNDRGTMVVRDNLACNSSRNRRIKKYSKVIEVLKYYKDENVHSVYKRLQMMGIEVSEPTVKKLREEFVDIPVVPELMHPVVEKWQVL